MIPDDGEGATHLITIDVEGCRDRDERPGHRPRRGRQPAREDRDPRRRPELGPDRLGRRLRRRRLRGGRTLALAQRRPALPSTASPCPSTPPPSPSASRRSRRDVDIRLTLTSRRSRGPVLDLRPDGRVCPAQRRLHDLIAISGDLWSIARFLRLEFRASRRHRFPPRRADNIRRPRANDEVGDAVLGVRNRGVVTAGLGLLPMKKTLKTLLLLGSGLVLFSFGVIVVNQTAQVVSLAKQVHPVLGTVTLWGLIVTYSGLIGVPVVMVLRMPRAPQPAGERVRPRVRGPSRRPEPPAAIQPPSSRPPIGPTCPSDGDDRGGPRPAGHRGQRRGQADGDDRLLDDRRLAERPARCAAGPAGPVSHGLAGRPPLLSAAVPPRDGPSVRQRGGDRLRGRRARRPRAASDDPAGRRRLDRHGRRGDPWLPGLHDDCGQLAA